MKYYSILSTLMAWIFPTKNDRRKFRLFCREIDARKDTKIIQERYTKILRKLQQDIKIRKLKVIFFNSENSKWAYQSLYEKFSKHPKFDAQILITIRKDLLKEKSIYELEKQANDSYSFFKKRNMNVNFAFDFKKKEFRFYPPPSRYYIL